MLDGNSPELSPKPFEIKTGRLVFVALGVRPEGRPLPVSNEKWEEREMGMDVGHGAHPPKLPHSRLGRVSTAIAVFAVVILIAYMLVVRLISPPSPVAEYVRVLVFMGLAFFCFVGLGFGMLGLRDKQHHLTLAIVGVVTNLCVLTVVALYTT